jgi:hypothetical protein
MSLVKKFILNTCSLFLEYNTIFTLDFEENSAPILPKGNDKKVKKSLNFNDGSSNGSRPNSSMSGHATPSCGSRPNSRMSGHTAAIPDEAGRKRMQDEVFGSLSDDEELCGKGKRSFILIVEVVIKNKPNCFNLMVGSNPPKKSRSDSLLLDDSATQTIPEIYEEPRAFCTSIRPKRYVFRLVPEEPHQCVTTHTGQKLFIRLKTEELLKQTVTIHSLCNILCQIVISQFIYV